MALTIPERSVQKIRRVAPDQRRRYAEALQASILWDPEEDVLPISTDELSKEYSLPLAAMAEQLIIVDKKGAVEFLNELGLPVSVHSFRRSVTATFYKRSLKRKATTLGRKLVFSYGEILFLVDYRNEVKVPSGLLRFLS